MVPIPKLKGATTIITVDSVPEWLEMPRTMDADHLIDFSKVDPVTEVVKISEGRGVDAAMSGLAYNLPKVRSGLFHFLITISLENIA